MLGKLFAYDSKNQNIDFEKKRFRKHFISKIFQKAESVRFGRIIYFRRFAFLIPFSLHFVC